MQTAPDPHISIRIPHELVRRHLTVVDAGHVTPRMRRVVFAGPSLRTFSSLGV